MTTVTAVLAIQVGVLFFTGRRPLLVSSVVLIRHETLRRWAGRGSVGPVSVARDADA